MPARENRLAFSLFAVFFALYFGLGFSGYGNDNDTYGMLRTWSDFFRHGVYSPSRMPGYPVPEMAIGALAQAGGWIASNALSALLAAGCLALFHRLIRIPFGPRAALLSAAAAGLNPYFIIAASSSMDYVYAAFFFLAGITALVSGGFLFSGLLFALCIASRLTYAPLIVLAYAAALFSAPGPISGFSGALRKTAAAFALFLLLGFLAYLPSWFSQGPGMFKPTLSDAPVSLLGLNGFPSLTAYAVRFVYKNVSLWGLPACMVIAVAIFIAMAMIAKTALRRGHADVISEGGEAGNSFSSRTIASLRSHSVSWAVLAGILYAEILFFRLPLEINYLLPVLFLGIFLLNRAPKAELVLILIALCHALQGVAQVDFIEKIYARQSFDSVEASGGRVHLHISRGVVCEDLRTRKEAQAHYFRTIVGDSTGLPSGM